ncbi:MAG: CHC2 zinc finger domain-containing protein [Candidatus Nanoarchaeia archaeon]|nr:CHC2 zinc finger domain-containing protein [Candidatus Nanoarchaeia archaeon]
MMIENYKKVYNEIYSRVKIENVLKHYNLEFKTYRTQKGREFMCPCPFHDDTTPSFSIQEKTGIYNCFVCGGGDFIRFIKNLEGLKTTKEAIEFAKIQVGINETVDVFSIVKNSTFQFFDNDCYEEENNELKEVVLPPSEPAEKYYDIVKKRVCLEDIKKYGMRYCVDDRIFHDRLIIPVYLQNKLVTFAARDMSGKSDIWAKAKAIMKKRNLSKQDKQRIIDKYLYKKILYPFGTPMSRLFFNWDESVKNKKEVFICEGIFDALKIIRFGYNVVALLSCHLNTYKMKQLVQNFERIYIALDNDDKIDMNGNKSNPGQEAAQKIMEEYLTDVPVFNLVLPEGKDPDDCTKEEFDRALDDAKKMQKVFTLALH